MSAAAVIPSLLPLVMVVAMRRAEERIHRQLESAGAIRAEAAIPLALTRSIDRRRLQGLLGGGAVRVAPNGHYYLDVDGWSTHKENRRRRVLLALAVVVALLGALAAVFFLLR